MESFAKCCTGKVGKTHDDKHQERRYEYPVEIVGRFVPFQRKDRLSTLRAHLPRAIQLEQRQEATRCVNIGRNIVNGLDKKTHWQKPNKEAAWEFRRSQVRSLMPGEVRIRSRVRHPLLVYRSRIVPPKGIEFSWAGSSPNRRLVYSTDTMFKRFADSPPFDYHEPSIPFV